MRKHLEKACFETQRGKLAMRGYWSAHQRFFKQLCISIKVPKIAAQAKAALDAGKCVVIGLQTTGESALEDYLAKSKAQPSNRFAAVQTFDGFVSGKFTSNLPLLVNYGHILTGCL